MCGTAESRNKAHSVILALWRVLHGAALALPQAVTKGGLAGKHAGMKLVRMQAGRRAGIAMEIEIQDAGYDAPVSFLIQAHLISIGKRQDVPS